MQVWAESKSTILSKKLNFKGFQLATAFQNLIDQLATDMTYLNELLIRRDRYGQEGLDGQIALLQQAIDIKRALAQGQVG